VLTPVWPIEKVNSMGRFPFKKRDRKIIYIKEFTGVYHYCRKECCSGFVFWRSF